MKRSEMELYLEQQLIELRGYQEDNAEIVDVLLYAVEEAGMLPPPTDIEYGVTQYLCCVVYDYLDMEDYVKQSLWEPEDE